MDAVQGMSANRGTITEAPRYRFYRCRQSVILSLSKSVKWFFWRQSRTARASIAPPDDETRGIVSPEKRRADGDRRPGGMRLASIAREGRTFQFVPTAREFLALARAAAIEPGGVRVIRLDRPGSHSVRVRRDCLRPVNWARPVLRPA